MQTAEVTITDPIGIHARPAADLVKAAGQYQARVRIGNGSRWADARSIVQLLGLAVRQGSVITITAEGADEEAALAGIVEVLNKGVAA